MYSPLYSIILITLLANVKKLLRGKFRLPGQ